MAVVLTDRGSRAAGWTLAVVAVAALVTVPFTLSQDVLARPGVLSGRPQVWVVSPAVALTVSGAFLVHLRPRNLIGWLLLACGVLQVANIAGGAYATRALTDADESVALGLSMAWLASWTWLPSLLLPALVLPAIYPDGRPPNRFWRRHVTLSLVAITLGAVALAISAGNVFDAVSGTPLPWTAPLWATYAVGFPAVALMLVSALIVTVGTLVRATRATYPERQQLLWLVSVVFVMLLTVWVGPEVLLAISYTLIPVAVAIGVLRYRLLGIEVVLRRTLLYLPLTALVALIVGGTTTVLARLTPDGPVALLVSSAVVAVLIIPVARRLRVLIDRFVRGPQVDPLSAVDTVSAGLEAEHDDPTLAMLEAVSSATGATHAAVLDAEGRRIAVVGTPGRAEEQFPLRHGGTDLGRLWLGPRPGRNRVSPADHRLAAALAPQLAVVLRSQLLTAELARERERVSTATTNERDRLRRDLHDGLGPSLSGIALGLQAAVAALPHNPGAAAQVLTRSRAEAESAVAEIRRVLDGLRPGALDRHDLRDAVHETATALGMGPDGSPTFKIHAPSLPLLAPQVEEAAYRILAESLTNVARHSGARHCTVTLLPAEGNLRLSVTDDGCGPAATRPPGHGLESMRRRAVDAGGELHVEPDPQGGTRVLAVLPLRGPA